MKESYKNALKEVYTRLKNKEINWAIFGSTNLLLQGINVEPNDIDILTDNKGAYEIEKLLIEYSTKKVKYSSDGKVTSHFGALGISGVKAEIVGDYTSNKDMQLILDVKDKIMVNFEDIQIPCLPLEKELIAYKKENKNVNRLKKVKLIENCLNK